MTEPAPPQPGARGVVGRLSGRTDVLAGAMFAAIALFGLYLVRGYDMGTAARMGTGYAPRLVCWILLALGVAVAARGLYEEPEETSPVPWRPLVAIISAVLLFGLLVERMGLVVAAAALIAAGSIAARGVRPLESLALGLGLIAGSVLVFVWGLGLPLDVWPDF